MAKQFIYQDPNLPDVTLTDGYLSSASSFTSSGTITNESRCIDQSIGSSSTWADTSSYGFNCALRFDFGSAVSIGAFALHTLDDISALANISLLYSSSPTSGYTGLVTNTALTQRDDGWYVKTASAQSARYWIAVLYDTLTFADVSVQEIILGNVYSFDLGYDLNNVKSEIFGNSVVESYGGITYSNKRHDPKTQWEWNWSNIGSSMSTSLEGVRDDVAGDFSKFLFYDETTYNWGRMSADSLQMTEIAWNRYSTKFQFTEELE